jgi:hypothetical protein
MEYLYCSVRSIGLSNFGQNLRDLESPRQLPLQFLVDSDGHAIFILG